MPGCRGPALARRACLSPGRFPLAAVFTRAARFSRSSLAHGASAFRGAAVSAQLRACAGQIETMSPPSRAQALDVIYTREREPCQETHDLCPALIIADGDQVHYMGYFCTWLNLFKGEKNKKMRLSLPANRREWPLADTRGWATELVCKRSGEAHSPSTSRRPRGNRGAAGAGSGVPGTRTNPPDAGDKPPSTGFADYCGVNTAWCLHYTRNTDNLRRVDSRKA